MTTIAWDGDTLCVDSMQTCDGMRFGLSEKVRKLNDGSLLAVAGPAWGLDAMASYLEGGQPPEFGDEDMDALLITSKGEAYEFDQTHRFSACVPWAGGTGDKFAMTAMHLGKTAREAVQVACQLDVYSGGPVKEYRP